MNEWPAPRAVAFFFANSVIAGSVPDQRTKHFPDASQNARPNLMPGTAPTSALVHVLDRLDEMRLAEDEVRVVGLLDLYGDELHVAPFQAKTSALASLQREERGSDKNEQAGSRWTLLARAYWSPTSMPFGPSLSALSGVRQWPASRGRDRQAPQRRPSRRFPEEAPAC